MGDLYVVFRFVPYVFGFLSEQWTRVFSRNWPATQGTVVGGGVEGQSSPYMGTLRYQYSVGASLFDGYLSRRCLRLRSAEALGKQLAGRTVEVRFKPDRPERSYAMLPLAWDGFAVVALPIFAFAAFLSLLVYAMVQDRFIEAHDAI